jgi:hypothetical protein
MKRLEGFDNADAVRTAVDAIVIPTPLATPVSIANGGTGQTTAQLAINALAGAVTDHRLLKGNGTNITLDQVDLATDVTGTLPDSKLDAIATASKVNTSALTGTTYVPDATVDTTALKTAESEVTATNETYGLTAVAGGQYCFYPQIKMSDTGTERWACGIGNVDATQKAGVTTYGTYCVLGCTGAGNTMYAKFLYVTASGEDYWLWFIVNSFTHEVLATAGASDHPAYGNSNDFTAQPHPFLYYNPLIHDIILVEKTQAKEIQSEAQGAGASVLTLVNSKYVPNYDERDLYVPIHSGQYTPNKEPVLVESIPDYIQVRKLILK